MCFYSLEDFRNAERGELHKDCLRRYLDKARKLIASAGKDKEYVDRTQMEPYQEHGFNALHDFAKETLKMLMLANGGGAVAILTLGGRMAKDGTVSLPQFLYCPLWLLLGGTISVVAAVSCAMFSQKHFNEPIEARNGTENIVQTAFTLYRAKGYQDFSKWFATISATVFILGVFIGMVNS